MGEAILPTLVRCSWDGNAARRRRADRERLRAGGQDRSDPAHLGPLHTFLTTIPLFCRHLPITVFRLDALHHLLGAPPKGARGAAARDSALGDRRRRVLLAL